MTDVQPIAAQVMCRDCLTPTPREHLAHDEHGIRTDLCRWCAGEDIGCEPSWVELTRPVRPTITQLPDIATYQEHQ